MENEFICSRPLSADQRHLLEKIKSGLHREEIRAVSFKMEDTLVLMPFSEKNDVFLLMENDFSMMYTGKSTFAALRAEAEDKALKKCAKKGTVTLGLIYDILMKNSKISPSSRDKLIQRERSLAEYFCFPRQCGLQLFKEAKSAGKKVIITSSSPMPEETVRKILSNCGYDDFDKLIMLNKEKKILSSEETCRLIIEESGVEAHLITHIGGDVARDIEEPVKLGMKAMYLSPVTPLMVKSGRLRGFIQKQLFYDYEEERYLAMRCAFALYAAYAFDVPQNKTPHSDFCGDDYMIGFIVLGPLSLYKDFVISSALEANVLGAMSRKEKMIKGRDDFTAMFEAHFGDFLEKYGFDGCGLPLEFYIKHCSAADRMSVQKQLSAEDMIKWAESVTEPEIAPVYLKKVKKSALSKLADRLFQPGSHIRTIIDRILANVR